MREGGACRGEECVEASLKRLCHFWNASRGDRFMAGSCAVIGHFWWLKFIFFAFSRICIATGEPQSWCVCEFGTCLRNGSLTPTSRLLSSPWTSGARPDLLFHLRVDRGQRSLVMACNGRTVREHRGADPLHYTPCSLCPLPFSHKWPGLGLRSLMECGVLVWVKYRKLRYFRWWSKIDVFLFVLQLFSTFVMIL